MKKAQHWNIHEVKSVTYGFPDKKQSKVFKKNKYEWCSKILNKIIV